MHSLTFTVPGDPIPKARPRVMGRWSYTPARTVNAQKSVAWAAKINYRQPPSKDQVRLVIVFYTSTWRRMDLDNLEKLVMDALNGIVYVDDSQVIEKHTYRRLHKENPRTVVVIDFLEKRCNTRRSLA